jgi:hypothetical protein
MAEKSMTEKIESQIFDYLDERAIHYESKINENLIELIFKKTELASEAVTGLIEILGNNSITSILIDNTVCIEIAEDQKVIDFNNPIDTSQEITITAKKPFSFSNSLKLILEKHLGMKLVPVPTITTPVKENHYRISNGGEIKRINLHLKDIKNVLEILQELGFAVSEGKDCTCLVIDITTTKIVKWFDQIESISLDGVHNLRLVELVKASGISIGLKEKVQARNMAIKPVCLTLYNLHDIDAKRIIEIIQKLNPLCKYEYRADAHSLSLKIKYELKVRAIKRASKGLTSLKVAENSPQPKIAAKPMPTVESTKPQVIEKEKTKTLEDELKELGKKYGLFTIPEDYVKLPEGETLKLPLDALINLDPLKGFTISIPHLKKLLGSN